MWWTVVWWLRYILGKTLSCCVNRNNDNLGRLSCKIISPLVFAHVRTPLRSFPAELLLPCCWRGSEPSLHPYQYRLCLCADVHDAGRCALPCRACRSQSRTATPSSGAATCGCTTAWYAAFHWLAVHLSRVVFKLRRGGLDMSSAARPVLEELHSLAPWHPA